MPHSGAMYPHQAAGTVVLWVCFLIEIADSRSPGPAPLKGAIWKIPHHSVDTAVDTTHRRSGMCLHGVLPHLIAVGVHVPTTGHVGSRGSLLLPFTPDLLPRHPMPMPANRPCVLHFQNFIRLLYKQSRAVWGLLGRRFLSACVPGDSGNGCRIRCRFFAARRPSVTWR